MEAGKMTVTVYTTPRCQQCNMTKGWLNQRGVDYTIVDLSTDAQSMLAVKELGYEAAPVVIVNDDGDTKNEKHWFGFRPDLLAEFTQQKAA